MNKLSDKKNEFIEKLYAIGINVDDVMEIMCDDITMYKSILCEFKKDKSYENMINALENKDFKSAFINAHTLKGILSNLCIDDMFKICSEIVEKLRHNDYYNINVLVNSLSVRYDEIIRFINRNCFITEV